jgi:hypothetical protein
MSRNRPPMSEVKTKSASNNYRECGYALLQKLFPPLDANGPYVDQAFDRPMLEKFGMNV